MRSHKLIRRIVLVFVFFSCASMSMEDSEADRAAASVYLASWDKLMDSLILQIGVYETILNKDMQCPLKKIWHIGLQTKLRKWHNSRHKQLADLREIISLENANCRRKLAMLSAHLKLMKAEWDAEETNNHDSFTNLFCRSQDIYLPVEEQSLAPEHGSLEDIKIGSESDLPKVYWDRGALYFHTEVEKIVVALEEIVNNNPNSFQKLLCSHCKKKQPRFIYVYAKGDSQFYLCKICDKAKKNTFRVNKKTGTKKIAPDFKARCSGCHLEGVNTYCENCQRMEYCTACSTKKDVVGDFTYKCTKCSSKKPRKLVQCKLPADDD